MTRPERGFPSKSEERLSKAWLKGFPTASSRSSPHHHDHDAPSEGAGVGRTRGLLQAVALMPWIRTWRSRPWFTGLFPSWSLVPGLLASAAQRGGARGEQCRTAGPQNSARPSRTPTLLAVLALAVSARSRRPRRCLSASAHIEHRTPPVRSWPPSSCRSPKTASSRETTAGS